MELVLHALIVCVCVCECVCVNGKLPGQLLAAGIFSLTYLLEGRKAGETELPGTFPREGDCQWCKCQD